MRISPVNVNYSKPVYKQPTSSRPNFRSKNQCTKFFAGVCGTLGTLGAIGGLAVMTGGVSLIPTLIYGGGCAVGGALVGHLIDKDAEENEDDKK